ncbi:MAG: 23S rRNA pseudouridine(1911/1915/1917) synthase RluD [Legionellaceae bacterium]|nr:23S rRNA pseudouridine(1911/1915/1917) synthase RluD [Legionellaceae bacterium]
MSQPLPTDVVIAADYHGQRLDQTLAQLFPCYSRSRWCEWIKQGKILLNQQKSKPRDILRQNDIVNILVQPEQELRVDHQAKAQALTLDILFEDAHLLVLNKPAGLVVHPGAGNAEHTLLNALLYHHEAARQLIRGGIVHRLDKETTGLIVVAKTVEAQTALIQQLQARDISREYLALVYGHIISGGEIATHYGRHPKNRLKMAVLSQGKEALTYYKLEKQYQDYTLLRVKLATGRTHQIRVHMAHIHHPLVGDPLYGARLKIPAQATDELSHALRAFKRQALHAVALAFHHPVTHAPLHFTAPLPADFGRLLALLEASYAVD